MKKYFILSFAALALLSCKNNIPVDRYNFFPSQVKLESYNHLEFIKIKSGSTVKVVVNDNPSTGYSWSTESQKDCVVTVKMGDFVQNDAPEGAVGVGGTRTFEITGKKAGTCLVEFKHTSPGQENQEKKAIYFTVE